MDPWSRYDPAGLWYVRCLLYNLQPANRAAPGMWPFTFSDRFLVLGVFFLNDATV